MDWKRIAKKLLSASLKAQKRGDEFADSQDGLHYRAYLRAVMAGNGDQASHMAKRFKGGKKAREDLIDEGGKEPLEASMDKQRIAGELLRMAKGLTSGDGRDRRAVRIPSGKEIRKAALELDSMIGLFANQADTGIPQGKAIFKATRTMRVLREALNEIGN